MISYTSKVVNNTFQVTFDFTPKDIKCSRNNYTATHKGGSGTSARSNIWEGIEILDVQTKVGNEAWKSHGTKAKVTVSTSQNGVIIQGWAKYQLRTMGYHFQCTTGSIPFFYYGNIDGNPKKYVGGYFTNATPVSPGANLHGIHAVVPKDWTYSHCHWSDWAYNHGVNTGHWEFADGRFEQRNGNLEAATSSNGWISDSGYKQAYRKSCMFFFKKDYYSSKVTSSGISVEATTPGINVIPAKGTSGQVTLTYKGDVGGRFKLVAYCKDESYTIANYPTNTLFKNGETWTCTNSFEKMFGADCQGNDVTYEAWAKNTYDKTSKSTGKKGGHRYNAAPSIPNGLFVNGANDIIYNKITFSWNKSSDKDGDSVLYDLWLKAVKPDGSVIKDDYIKNNLNALQYDYDISNHPDETTYEFWVRSTDGIVKSEWSNALAFKKGAKPTGILNLISPVMDNNDLWGNSPRFVFKGYDGESELIVEIDDKEFSSIKNPELFFIAGDLAMFKRNLDDCNNSIKIQAYLKNVYGISEKSSKYAFNRKIAFENVTEGNLVKVFPIIEVQKQILNKAKAYNLETNIELVEKENFIKAKDFNDCLKALKDINSSIDNIIKLVTNANYKFKVDIISEEISPGDYIDDLLWENLAKDINNI